MSIPRDLKVEIPGYGTDKFNAAYAFGGPKLTLRVVKELTGLQINHVVNVDFLGFVRAVDAIGCVCADVDRRYYHSNVGVPPSEQYSEINIKPGYQLLCGKNALAYVRYRHTDTDLVRSARQQDFLREARQRVPISDLVVDQQRADRHLHQLHDLRHQRRGDDAGGAETVLRLPQRDDQGGPLPGRTRPELRLRVARKRSTERSNSSSASKPSGGPRGSLDEPGTAPAAKKKARARRSRSRGKPKLKVEAARQRRPGPGAAKPAKPEAEAVARKVSAGFPVFYPTRLPSGAAYVETDPYEHIDDPRVYHLKDTDGNRHGAYRMVATLELPDGATTSACRGSAAGATRRSSTTRA